MRNEIGRLVVGGLLVLVAGGALWAVSGAASSAMPGASAGSGSPTAAASADARVQVQTVAPAVVTGSRAYTIPGRTEAQETALVFTRATGIVKERRFDIGDHVKAGDVLAVIDTPEIDREVESAAAVVDRAKARADNAKVLMDRAERLSESKAISQEEIDQRRAGLAEAAADLRFAQADLARLQEQQRFATVRAPFSGLIAGRNFDRGDRVKGDSADAQGWLYRLVRIETLRFVIAAPADLALRVREGAVGRVRFNEFPDREIEGKVTRFSGVIDEASGTMRVELAVLNEDSSLPAGLTGLATFELESKGNVFTLPNNTTMVDKGQNRVATVEGGKVRLVPVVLGRNLGGRTEVQSALLTAVSRVVINPNAMLRDGDEVNEAAQVEGKKK